jgi:hypothetical protein
MNHVIEPVPAARREAYVVLVNIGEAQAGGSGRTPAGTAKTHASRPQGWSSNGAETPRVRAPGARATGRGPPPQAQARQHPRRRGPKPSRPDYIDIRALANLCAYGLDSGTENGTAASTEFSPRIEFQVRRQPRADAVQRVAGKLRKFASQAGRHVGTS